MNERRQISNRVDDVSRMTELQLREEKSELQRELLVLESQFGRPQAGPERQAVRMIYHRYRELKKKLSDLDNRFVINHLLSVYLLSMFCNVSFNFSSII